MTTPQGIDVTTKRASKPDSAADEDSFSLMKKPRIEEEEEEEEEKVNRNRFPGYVLVGRVWVPEYEEPEPEWDVDSHDGIEYVSDPEDRKIFSDEDEYKKYSARKRKTIQSKGFLPDYENGIVDMGHLDARAKGTMTNRDVLTELAWVCINKLNEDKGKTVELESIVRATFSGGLIWKIRITIMVREYPNGPLVEYQAKVLRYIANYKPPFPIFCRPSPTPNLTF